MTKRESTILYVIRMIEPPYRCYIGKKLASRNKDRNDAHRRADSGMYFHNWIQKHVYAKGLEFEDVLEYFELETYSGDNVAAREHHYIDLWGALKDGPGGGFNIQKTGAGGKWSKATREKLSKVRLALCLRKETHPGVMRQSQKVRSYNKHNCAGLARRSREMTGVKQGSRSRSESAKARVRSKNARKRIFKSLANSFILDYWEPKLTNVQLVEKIVLEAGRPIKAKEIHERMHAYGRKCSNARLFLQRATGVASNTRGNIPPEKRKIESWGTAYVPIGYCE